MGLGFIDSNFNKSTAITAVLPAKLIHLSTYCHTFGQTQRMQYLGDIPVKQLLPGFFGKMVHGESSSLVFWDIKKDSVLPEHSHIHEQITHIVEGELEMVIGGKKYLLTAGSVHVIPSLVPHSALAITDCRVIDTFSPARDDYR
jgi:quercetin dioxygenase-like cupin family protein